ncbi:MAG: imidazole glycerol phosphate synthase subunit HisH [Clostridia bacterium]|nr:imidazole glycerol phosphate synthase subunit HisH [Clostridia bacterium]
MIAIIDYGVGNLFSLQSSFNAIGAEAIVTKDKTVIENAEKLILPGVGAFEDAAKKLRESGLGEVLKNEVQKGKTVMGICLGMQLLFDKSYEFGVHEGLGLIPGNIVPFADKIDSSFQIPQIGWNNLKLYDGSTIFKNINDGDFVYFVHSYYAECDKKYVLATSDYGIEFTAAVGRDNVFGCQFHPEKSGEVGLNILRGFCQMK